MQLSALGGVNGVRLDGTLVGDRSGTAVSGADDVNGDGFDDLLVGAPGAGLNGVNAGVSYVVFGRDFAGAASQLGDAGDNNLTGTLAAEILIGELGNDLLDGVSGSDVLRAVAGNDTLVWHDNARLIDGGSGLDTLRIDGSGVALDLSLLASNRITGIERIDLTGSGDNSLTLNVQDVLALPHHADHFLDTSTQQLLIDGNAGDSVHANGQGWLQGDDVTFGEGAYASYAQLDSAAQLLVNLDITRDIS